MRAKILSIIALTICINLQAQAQVDSLMQVYDFAGAARLLRTQINKARNAGEPVATLQERLRQAEMGERMLPATEQVVFLDSIVMPAESVLSKIRLTSHAGRLMAVRDFFGQDYPQGFTGQGTMYIGDYGDRIFLSQADSTGLHKLHQSRLLGGTWSAPQLLPGLENTIDTQDFPFALPDGQTLYFAASGEQSLGGYDIFVTRYDADQGRYLKPAHLGFPFNSTANDYLYIIDEAAGVGYFISDRNQPTGYVCLYAFIPNTTHDIYMLSAENADSVRRAARIASIQELGAESEQALAARRKANKALSASYAAQQTPIYIVIDDNHVYTQPTQLKNETAARIATEYVNRQRELIALEQEIEAARENYVAMPSQEVGSQILALEQRIDNLRNTIHRLSINMRKAELGE
ncbi:MAG: PD40 domain-containing protein [Bacteroidaceae bacterium]|nr:PD40 domain-containing protein [Bacteroidaceae bacterium]